MTDKERQMTAAPRAMILMASIGMTAAALSGCAPKAPAPAAPASQAALPVMERVALGANACWFKSKDPSFSGYRLAPELNSFSGRPRILLVKAHSPESRPLLVVQAEGNPARLETFGPMMGETVAVRINDDVNRWARGDKRC